MKKISKKEAQKEIEEFFKKEKLNLRYIKKIKRLAMRHNIKLGNYRKRFCKKCYSDLKSGGIRINKGYKIAECPSCGFKNRWEIK